MKTSELLARLRRLDVKLWVEGTELRCSAPKGVLTPELRDDLTGCKQELLTLLASEAASETAAPIPRVRRDGPLPLSFTQQRLWFLDQLEPGQATYNMWIARRLVGPLDVDVLERSVAEIVRRHEILRTTFVDIDGVPSQVIAETVDFELERLENDKDRPIDVWREHVRLLFQERLQEPFDLSAGPLVRATVARIQRREHYLHVQVHHTVFDQLSIGVFMRELAALYEAFTEGRSSLLPELPIQFADYAAWQHEFLRGEEFARQQAYWHEELSGDLPVLELPTDRPRPPVQTFRGAVEKNRLEGELIDALDELGNHERVTLFMTLLAAYQVLLRRYTGAR